MSEGGLSRRALAPALLFGLAGCSSLLGGGPAPDLYRLDAIGGFPPDLPQRRAQLLVAEPECAAGLDTKRIALTRSPTSLDYFAASEWVDRLPRLVQSVLLASFENSGAIPAIGRDSSGVQADFLLRSEIRHFEAGYAAPAGPPVVRVAILARLVRLPEGKIIDGARFAARRPARLNTVPAVVAAFDAALGEVMRRIVLWTLADPAVAPARRGTEKKPGAR